MEKDENVSEKKKNANEINGIGGGGFGEERLLKLMSFWRQEF